MSTPQIYVIIVTYNGIKWIDRCFESLSYSSVPIKILAIDNASSDGTPEAIRMSYPSVEVIEMGHNLGFGKANNIGLKRVLEDKVQYAFLLNQDAWIEKDTLSNLIEVAEKNPEFGVISPVHLNASNSGLDAGFSNYIVPDNCPSFYSDIYMGQMKELYKTRFVNAAAWLISLPCICKVGLFEPLFFLYGEDDNYLQRVSFHGFSIGIAANVKIYHDREERTGKHNSSRTRNHLRKTNLVCLLNINKSIGKSYIKFLELNFTGFIKSIFLFKPRWFFFYLYELLYFTFRILKVRNARKNALQ